MTPLALGIDVGTSGVRLAAMGADNRLEATASAPTPSPRVDGALVRQRPDVWRSALKDAFRALSRRIDLGRVRALAVDATSGSLLPADMRGEPLDDAAMYNDAGGARFAHLIDTLAPEDSAARGASSGLARALDMEERLHPARILHQSDWLNGLLTGDFGLTDESNALKTGYDPLARRWPDWIGKTGLDLARLPARVVPCGEVMGMAAGAFAASLGLSSEVRVVAGCTDGCAAFLASGADKPGDAVTSLGSTITLKILSTRPVSAPAKGVYSHRIGDLWLPGGASNAGGAAIADLFDQSYLHRLEGEIDTDKPTGLFFYPLRGRGERFPVSDPNKRAVMEPRPASDALFLQALYEALARIEVQGFEALAAAGAPRPARLFTLGGGSDSAALRRIRERALAGVALAEPAHREAAAGVARLALRHLA